MNNSMKAYKDATNGYEFYFFTKELDKELPIKEIKANWYNLQVAFNLTANQWDLINFQNEVIMANIPCDNYQDAILAVNSLRAYVS